MTPFTHRTGTFLAAAAAFAFLSPCVAAASSIPWHDSLESAQAASQLSHRPVLLIFEADWCEACQRLDATTWTNAEAAALVAACFEPVRVNVDAVPDLARRYGVSHLPSACVIAADGTAKARFDLPETASGFIASAGRAVQQAAEPPAAAVAAAVAPTSQPVAQPVAQPPATVANASPPQQAAATMPKAPPAWPAETARGPAAASTASAVGPRYGDSPSRQLIEPAATEAPWLSAAPPESTGPSATAAPRAAAPAAATGGYPDTGLKAANSDGGYAAAGFPGSPPSERLASLAPPTQPPAAAAAVTAAAKPADAAKPTDDGETDSPEPKKEKYPVLAAMQKPFRYFMPTAKSDDADGDDETETETETVADQSTPFPVGLEGYCPVSLAEQGTWVEGRAQWGAQHRGRTYLFAGETQQRKFLADPDRYAPALSGDDPVLAFESGTQIPGQRRYGVTYQGRIYLFSTLETRGKFAANPQAYATRVQLAENPSAASGGTLLR